MENSIVLFFNLDGILINTVEIFAKRVWQIISDQDLLNGSVIDSRIDHLTVMNWEKGSKFLSRAICNELGCPEKAAEFEKRMANIDYDMIAEFRLQQERFKMIKKLGNADFLIGLHTNRSLENLTHMARIVGLDLKVFNYVLTKDVAPSLSQWLIDEKIQASLIYFGNTAADAQLAPQGSVVIMPEFNKESEVINDDYLISYLENNFLSIRKFNPYRATLV